MDTETAEPAGAADPAALAVRFLDAFNAADLAGMRQTLADDAVAVVTGPDGNPVQVAGADTFVAALAPLFQASADFRVQLTQSPVVVDTTRVLVMIEVRARRGDRALHNYAAYLIGTSGGRIVQLFMVEAKPAESDDFWS